MVSRGGSKLQKALRAWNAREKASQRKQDHNHKCLGCKAFWPCWKLRKKCKLKDKVEKCCGCKVRGLK